jgi:hypothetical protein
VHFLKVKEGDPLWFEIRGIRDTANAPALSGSSHEIIMGICQ